MLRFAPERGVKPHGVKMGASTLSLVHEKGVLNVPDDALVVGIDETGCEDYKDEKFPVFGLGGCAILARDYFRFLDGPWKDIKHRYFGGADVQMHASQLRHPTPDQISALEDFFTKLPFFRFACMSANSFDNETAETNIHLIAVSVMLQICEFAALAQPSQIIFIVENSTRIGRDLVKHFSAYRYGNGEVDFAPQVLVASKSVNVSCVEVADFVIHPAGAQVRNRLVGFPDPMNIIRKDFDLVFHRVDRRLSSYQEILGAKPKMA